jgi:hypothetical protein
MVEARDKDVGLSFQQASHRKQHTIGGRSVDSDHVLVDTGDPQRIAERQGVA